MVFEHISPPHKSTRSYRKSPICFFKALSATPQKPQRPNAHTQEVEVLSNHTQLQLNKKTTPNPQHKTLIAWDAILILAKLASKTIQQNGYANKKRCNSAPAMMQE
jgi:hypothetical protein